MSDVIDETVPVDDREATDLGVHVTACHHRYTALDNRTRKTNRKLDRLEKRSRRIEWWIVAGGLGIAALDNSTKIGSLVVSVAKAMLP